MSDIQTARTEPDSGAEWAASLFARQNMPAEGTGESAANPGETGAPEQPAGADGSAVTQGAGGRPTPVDLSTLAAPADPGGEQGARPDQATQTSSRERGWAAVLIGLTAVCSVVAAGIMLADQPR